MAGLSCGVDIGTTNIKVVIIDGEGQVLARETRPTPRIASGEGDPLALVAALESMIIIAWKRVGTSAPIEAIAAAGVGEDGVLVDARLRPLGPAIPWFDPRAQAEAEELADRGRGRLDDRNAGRGRAHALRHRHSDDPAGRRGPRSSRRCLGLVARRSRGNRRFTRHRRTDLCRNRGSGCAATGHCSIDTDLRRRRGSSQGLRAGGDGLASEGAAARPSGPAADAWRAGSPRCHSSGNPLPSTRSKTGSLLQIRRDASSWRGES